MKPSNLSHLCDLHIVMICSAFVFVASSIELLCASAGMIIMALAVHAFADASAQDQSCLKWAEHFKAMSKACTSCYKSKFPSVCLSLRYQ